MSSRHPIPELRDPTPARYRIAVLGVLALAAAVALAGLGAEAPASHEIFVIQSAHEMARRGDWVVPYFNGVPRLTKPPLNYWLTGLVAWSAGHDRPTAFDGRLPSALAGVWLAGVTIWLGWRLLNRSLGINAGLVLVTCIGFLRYTHSARPEMTYAAACGTAIALFVEAWRSIGARRLLAALGVWVCFGIATLAKGPHVPALLLVGFILALVLHKSRRADSRGSLGGWSRFFATLRPIAGVLILLAITLPWWWLVQRHVGEMTVDQSQLSGSRFLLWPGNVLDPYYLYRPWALLLPWVVLWPFAVVLAIKRTRFGFAPRWLGALIAIAVVVMSFGGQKRWYYLLPYMAPACVLMALGLRWAWDRLPARWPRGVERAVAVAVGGGYLACGVLADQPTAMSWTIVGLGVAVVLAGARWWTLAPIGGRGDVPLAGNRLWVGVAMAVGLTLVVVQGSGVVDSSQQRQRNRFGQMVARRVPGDQPVVAYHLEAAYTTYQADRRVPTISHLKDLPGGSTGSGPVWVLYPSTVSAKALAAWGIRTRWEVPGCDNPHRAWRIGVVMPAGTGDEPAEP